MDFEEKNLIKLLKASGYVLTQDKMGYYFDKNDKKFSIIKTGNIYNVYYNKKIENNYQLQETLFSQILLKQCLFWIVNRSK